MKDGSETDVAAIVILGYSGHCSWYFNLFTGMNYYDLTDVNATDGAVTYNDNLVRFLRYDNSDLLYCILPKG